MSRESKNDRRRSGGRSHLYAPSKKGSVPRSRTSTPGQPLQRGQKPKKKGRLTRAQKALVALCVLLVWIIFLIIVYKHWFVKPELPVAPSPQTQTETDVIDTEYQGNGLQPKITGERKSEDFFTILVVGRDTGGGGNTDTMLLASYDVTNQKLTVMSIPRDTMVNVPWDIKRINSVYNFRGGGQKGIDALEDEVSELIGFRPDYQMVVEWEAVGKLVDAMGGVNFNVPRTMDYDDPTQNLHIHIKKGEQLLDGKSAMGVIRWRHNNSGSRGYATGDLGRIETQQAFLKAVVKQLLQINNMTKIHEFAEIFNEEVKTDLTVQNLFWFGKSAIVGGLSMDNVKFVTMPNTAEYCWSRSVKNNQSYVVPKPNEMLKLVNEDLNPFVKNVTLRQLDLMSVNRDGSISSTSGYVADKIAAKPPVKPPKEKPVKQSNLPINPDTGKPLDWEVDEATGLPIDPLTGNPVKVVLDEETGKLIYADTGELVNVGKSDGPAEETPSDSDSSTQPDQIETPEDSGSSETPEDTTVSTEATTPEEPTEPAEPIIDLNTGLPVDPNTLEPMDPVLKEPTTDTEDSEVTEPSETNLVPTDPSDPE